MSKMYIRTNKNGVLDSEHRRVNPMRTERLRALVSCGAVLLLLSCLTLLSVWNGTGKQTIRLNGTLLNCEYSRTGIQVLLGQPAIYCIAQTPAD